MHPCILTIHAWASPAINHQHFPTFISSLRKLTSQGASLSNADLEGLQRLRAASADLEVPSDIRFRWRDSWEHHLNHFFVADLFFFQWTGVLGFDETCWIRGSMLIWTPVRWIMCRTSPSTCEVLRLGLAKDKEKKVEGVKLLWPNMAQIFQGCWPAHIPQGLSPSPLDGHQMVCFSFAASEQKGERINSGLIVFFCFVRVIFLCYSRVVILLCRCDLKTEIAKSTLLMDNLPNSTRKSCDIDVLESFNIAVWFPCMTNNFNHLQTHRISLPFFEVQIPTSTRLVLWCNEWPGALERIMALPCHKLLLVELSRLERMKKQQQHWRQRSFLAKDESEGSGPPFSSNKNDQKIPKLAKTNNFHLQ